MAKVLIGLGSNIGNRQKNLFLAWEKIKNCCDIHAIAISRCHWTSPVGGPENQPMYLNAVCMIQTEIKPLYLLEILLEIEKSLGRERIIHHGPRTIDLDLLLYGNEIHSSESLIVPHPRMHERMFVLKPSLEIAPDFIHPVLQKTLAELFRCLP